MSNAAMDYLVERSSAQLAAIFAKLGGAGRRAVGGASRLGAIAAADSSSAKRKGRGFRVREAKLLKASRDALGSRMSRIAHSKGYTKRSKKLASKAK